MTPRLARCFVLLACVLALAAPASAQESASCDRVPGVKAATVVASLGGSLAGGFLGGVAGYKLDRARNVPSEDPGLAGMIYGTLLGSALAAPLLAARAEGSCASTGPAVLLSLGATALAGAVILGSNDGFTLPLLPLAQLAASLIGLGSG